jgi:hypothetical protein
MAYCESYFLDIWKRRMGGSMVVMRAFSWNMVISRLENHCISLRVFADECFIKR